MSNSMGFSSQANAQIAKHLGEPRYLIMRIANLTSSLPALRNPIQESTNPDNIT